MSDEDPWAFLSGRRKDDLGEQAAPPPVEPAPAGLGGAEALAALVPPNRHEAAPGERERRERGQLRGDMGGPSLRRRGWPLAVSLAAIAFAGYLTEVVASSQMLARAGSGALVVIFPLGGILLVVLAIAQFRYIDHHARLPMIRLVSLLYAAAFGVVLVLLGASVAPIVAVAIAWLLADQLTFLLPLLVWSLASDEFNVAESRKVYPWIVTWMFGGQVLGLIVSAVTPWVLASSTIPLTGLLVIPPLVCVAVGVILPRAMRDSHAATGSARSESLRTAVSSAKEFIDGVPVWRPFLLASVLTFISGGTLYLVFLANAEGIIGSDAARLQILLGCAGLAWFVVCWAIQNWVAEPLQDRIGIPGALLVLPFSLMVGGVIVAIGAAMSSLPLLIAGITFWLVPRWSIDENARRSALAFVPDERRARVSFIVDLIPVALGLILSGPLALFGIVTGNYWIIAIAMGVLAGLALAPSLKVRRDWDDSLLNWRLRRRKQNRSLDLG